MTEEAISRDVGKFRVGAERWKDPIESWEDKYRPILNWKEEEAEAVEVGSEEVSMEDADGFVFGTKPIEGMFRREIYQ